MCSGQTFFEELGNENISGVAYKNLNLKKKINAWNANVRNATITYLSKELNASSPKVTNLLTELAQEGLIQDYGKIDSVSGRRPNLYGLTPDAGFFIGVEVQKYHINLGLLDFKRNLVTFKGKVPYTLENSPASLDALCSIIQEFMGELPVSKQKILGVGLNLTGRINYATGYSYSFFYFNEEPLSKVIESRLGVRTFLENDSRAMAYGEFCCGIVNTEKNVLYINLDHGIGMGVMINGQLYYGKSGFSGEFGHIPFFDNELICHCGKKGCLETEASGIALLRNFGEKLREGVSSVIVTQHGIKPEEITLEDIVHAANNDDMLAIELIAEVGEKLGKGIAMLINLLNPEMVILGGCMATTGDYIRLPVKNAINRYSLSLVKNDTQLAFSRLGEKAGIIGACLLVRNKLLALA